MVRVAAASLCVCLWASTATQQVPMVVKLNGRAYVPLRDIADHFGYSVDALKGDRYTFKRSRPIPSPSRAKAWLQEAHELMVRANTIWAGLSSQTWERESVASALKVHSSDSSRAVKRFAFATRNTPPLSDLYLLTLIVTEEHRSLMGVTEYLDGAPSAARGLIESAEELRLTSANLTREGEQMVLEGIEG